MLTWIRTQLRFQPPNLRPTRQSFVALLFSAVAVALATLLAGLLENSFGIANASVVYLLAVVAVAELYGGWMAVSSSIAAFLIYDFLFVEPLYTFSIQSAEEWLDLLLFRVVAIAIGRLAAAQRARAHEAEFRTQEARAMFAMSREVGNSASALEAAPLLATRLVRVGEMSRVWLTLGHSVADERVIADTAPDEPRPSLASRWLLRAASAEVQPDWMRVRDSQPRRAGREREADCMVFRVPVEAGGETVGSVWATRARTDPFPGRSHTRLLAAAADQFGQAIVRDRLQAEATEAEIARQGDKLKSALLDSVSHDLRTPLAAIRASAGNLADPQVKLDRALVATTAREIDREADRLSRLVRNMLDLTRIQAGALDPSIQPYDLQDVLEPVIARLRGVFNDLPTLTVTIPDDLPPVNVDALFVDQIVSNLLENAVRHSAGAAIRLSATGRHGNVELLVEDAGPGVPASALPRLFDRFYRAPSGTQTRAPIADDREGMGVGLAVVRGLAEAMGGSVEARRSDLGGLAIAVRMPAALRLPADRVADRSADLAARSTANAGPAAVE